MHTYFKIKKFKLLHRVPFIIFRVCIYVYIYSPNPVRLSSLAKK